MKKLSLAARVWNSLATIFFWQAYNWWIVEILGRSKLFWSLSSKIFQLIYPNVNTLKNRIPKYTMYAMRPQASFPLHYKVIFFFGSLSRASILILCFNRKYVFQVMLDTFSKVVSYAIQNSVMSYTSLLEICCLCHRNFTKDRDKHYLSRTVVCELIQAIKFKTTLPDANFLLILQLVLQVSILFQLSFILLIYLLITEWSRMWVLVLKGNIKR